MLIAICAIGEDSHRFEPETSKKPLVLGGIEITGETGLAGNSDADVVLHALCNAISGISGKRILGDVADKMCKAGIKDSSLYVKKALETLSHAEITHVSFSLEAQKPHLAPHIDKMRANIANLLNLDISDVAITATSGENLTACGSGLGMHCFCLISALCEKSKK